MSMSASKPQPKEYRKTANLIFGASKIVIASHLNPDGDALGSMLGLTHALKALGKDVTLISTDGVPATYSWMPGAEWVQTATDRRDFELAIVVDAGALERIGTSQVPAIKSANTLIDIDHHVADTVFGDVRILDSSSASTAELICRLIRTMNSLLNRDLMTPAIADCLMTGIITDTGSFKFPNVTSKTLTTSAYLKKNGASVSRINELVYENRSLASLKLVGRAMESLRITPDGKVAWTHVTAKDLEETGGIDADTEGVVGMVRSIEGVEVGVLFREIPGKKVRISLRAREGSDVNRIANVFGGGGHRLAAGCSIEPPLEVAIRTVIEEVVRQIGSVKPEG